MAAAPPASSAPETKDDAIAAARELMRRMAAGILSTHSVSVPGYPLGSLVPFVMTPECRPVVYVSRIAQHTHNFEQDPHASLTVVEAALDGADGDPQALGRVSLLGDAHRLDGVARDAAAARYQSFFPESRGHEGVHDFDFWRIEPVRIRYIGGFGAIHWIEPQAFCLERAEWQDGEGDIVGHMNADHRDAMGLIWRQHAGPPDAAQEGEPEMLASDPEGFHMRWGDRILYLPYAKRCVTAMDVRKEMVRLTHAAREAEPTA